MIYVSTQQATDLKARGLIGFIFDGDRPRALKALGADDTGMFAIDDGEGHNMLASIVQIHPLTRRDGYDEHARFDRSRYIDHSTPDAKQMTALELSIRSHQPETDPVDGANQRRDIEYATERTAKAPGTGETTVASVTPEAAAYIAEPMPQAEQDKAPKANPQARLHNIGVESTASERSDVGAGPKPPTDVAP